MSKKQIIVIGIIAHFITAIFSLGYFHLDEHFQILEFAAFKLGKANAVDLPWEYAAQMRPALQPFIVYVLSVFVGKLGITNPFTITLLLRMLSAGLSLISVVLLVRLFEKEIKNERLVKWFYFLSFLFWLSVYSHARFSSESFSGSLFLIGFCLALNDTKRKTLYFVSGILLGLAFVARFQSAFLLVGFIVALIFLKKENWVNLFLLLIGAVFALVIGVLIDYWFYDKLVFTAWNYLEQNILQDKISQFGSEPFWFYFSETLLKVMPPFSLLLIGAFVLFIYKNPKHLITWSIVPFIVIHFFISHKELRFLFPVLSFVPIVFVLATQFLLKKKSNLLELRVSKIIYKSFIGINAILLLVFCLKSSNDTVSLFKFFYTRSNQPLTVNYLSNNPYNDGLEVNFYKPDNLITNKIDTLQSIRKGSNNELLVLTPVEVKMLPSDFHGNLVYTSIPLWVQKFNFNNWVERTRIWYVYEL